MTRVLTTPRYLPPSKARPCTRCGEIGYRSATSGPDSKYICLPCRRGARAGKWLFCRDCGQETASLDVPSKRGREVRCRACWAAHAGYGRSQPVKQHKRKSAAARGYGRVHRERKAAWQRLIDRRDVECHAVICLMPTRTIPRGTPPDQWDLGHTPDRKRWTGPEHPRCNRAEGAARGNRARGAKRHGFMSNVPAPRPVEEYEGDEPEALGFFD